MRFRSEARALAAAAAMIGLGASSGCAETDISTTAETSAGPARVEAMAGPFDQPWGFAFLPDGDVLVTEKGGALWRARPAPLSEGAARAKVAGAPEVAAGGQGGLLDVAVAPDFAESGVIYLTYSERADGGLARTTAARARLAGGAEAPRLENLEPIFRQQPAVSGGRHFGSRLVPAPDGTLFITTGDRGLRDPSQDLMSHIGKVIRILPDGSVPSDNPFVGRDDALPEIWSYGHRNIQGAALNPADGRVWTVEHGARGGDEINLPEAGANYGWPVISYGTHYSGAKIGEGTAAAGMEQPVHYWDPSIAPSGFAVHQGPAFAAWNGDFLIGALKLQHISRLELRDGRVVAEERLFEDAFGRIRDVEVDASGAIWFVTDDDPAYLYRATPDAG